MVFVYDGILLSHKKDETQPSVTTRVDLEGTMLSEMREKDKAIISPICGI